MPPPPPPPPPPPSAPAAFRPMRAPRPPRPPRPPRRRGPGFGAVVLVGGLALAAYGLGLWSHDTFGWRGSAGVVALSAALGVTGLALVVLGAAGRRARRLHGRRPRHRHLDGHGRAVSQRGWWSGRPGLAAQRDRHDPAVPAGHRLGRARPDPAHARCGGTAHARRRYRGRGAAIRVPANLTVEVRSSVGAGDVGRWFPNTLQGSDSSDTSGASSGPAGRNISTVETFGSGTPDVVVTAHVGLGQILIGKEGTP